MNRKFHPIRGLICGILIIALCAAGWLWAYHLRKSPDNLPSLSAVVKMNEGDANALLVGYQGNQLIAVWGEPTITGQNTYVWEVGRFKLTVNLNNRGEVVISGISENAALELGKISGLPQTQLENTLVGYSREQIHLLWGEPDDVVFGFSGDIYHVPNSYESIILCYNADSFAEAVKVDYRNDEP